MDYCDLDYWNTYLKSLTAHTKTAPSQSESSRRKLEDSSFSHQTNRINNNLNTVLFKTATYYRLTNISCCLIIYITYQKESATWDTFSCTWVVIWIWQKTLLFKLKE